MVWGFIPPDLFGAITGLSVRFKLKRGPRETSTSCLEPATAVVLHAMPS